MVRVGFVGLGIMGRPMSQNLLKAGYDLTVYNRSKGPAEQLASLGARVAKSPREAAEGAEVVITMVTDTPDVEEVILGRGGVIEKTCRCSIQPRTPVCPSACSIRSAEITRNLHWNPLLGPVWKASPSGPAFI